LAELPENTVVVVLDENGNPIPLASQVAADAILEDDPMWCPAGTLPNTTTCRNFTGANGITNLLTDMRNNTTAYDENGIIYFTSNPGNGPFVLSNAATSLNTGDFATLSVFNITLQGGWNGSMGGAATFTGQTNFGTNYIAVGTSANPWVGNVTINNMTVDGHTAANASIGVFTTNGSVTLNNLNVDDADNNESILVSTGSGNIIISNTDVTDGDDDYALNLTTTSGSVTLTDVLVDDHTDADAVRVVGGNGTVTLNNVDVTDGSDGDGIDITTTGGTVNLNGVDVDGQDGGNGINVTTTSGNINLNDADVQNHEDGRTANLVSTSGNINVINNSDFEGDNNNQGFNASTNTGSISINGSDFEDAQGSGNGTNYNGATLTAPIVTLTNVTSDDNDLNGILINATTTVTLNNVSAGSNGTNPSGAGNALGSGILINGDGSTLVNVTGGSFNDNERYGIEIYNATYNFISMPSFSDNGLGRYYPGGQDLTGPVITPNVFCTDWGTNGWCQGTLFVNFSVSEPESRVSSTSGCNGPFFGYFVLNSNTSASGQTYTCSATSADGTLSSTNSVTVYRDGTQPTLTLPANMTIEATGPSGAVASFTATSTDSVDPSVTPVCTPPSGSTFSLGITTVSCTATDDAGNSRSGNFTVTVQDTTPPSLSLPADMTVEATGPTGAAVSYSASASDLVDGSVTVTCGPPSGSTFSFGTTTVNCSAVDSRSNTATGSFTVTVQDTTPPSISPMANILVHTTNELGAPVNYSSPTTSDLVDGAGLATCIPPSGTMFPAGDTTVTCTATDSHGNTASITFNVHVNYRPATTTSSSGFGIIPVTGGEAVDLECFTIANAFGVLVTFYNLCDQQAVMDEINENTLPSALPSGYTFVKGLNIDILGNGQLLNVLPTNSGVQMDFPLPGGSDFAVLYWNGSEWVEISQLMDDADLDAMLSTDAENELYKMSSSNAGVSKALTTELIGTFVLVQK
jgi:hypothetical protein